MLQIEIGLHGHDSQASMVKMFFMNTFQLSLSQKEQVYCEMIYSDNQ